MYHNVLSVSITFKCNLDGLNPENTITLEVCSSYPIHHIALRCYIREYFVERQ